MRRLLDSSLAVVLLALVLVLEVFRSCQLDRIEARLIAVEHGAGQPSAPSEVVRPTATSTRSEAPGNLLVPLGRPWLRATRVARGGTLRLELTSDPKSLNPYTGTGADLTELDRYLNARLAARHPDDPERYTPELAVRVETPDDGLSYVVTLRDGVRWSPPRVDLGDPRHAWLRGPHALTSDDFAFVFEVLQNPQVSGRATMLRGGFEQLAGVDVLDPLRFRVRFKARLYNNLAALLDLSPLPRFLYRADEDGRPLDAATWGQRLNEHWYNQRGMGVGPYRFVAWEPGVRVELERNPDFWGEPPSFDRVLFRIVKDPAAAARMLQGGELDLARISPEIYRRERAPDHGPVFGDPAIETAHAPELGYVFLGWNQARPFFQDARVRRAMTLALDRARIVEHVFAGLGTPISGPFARQQPCYDASIAPLPYDLAAARALLDDAGWRDSDGDGLRDRRVDGKKLDLDFTLLLFAASPEWDAVASVYQQALADLGVRMRPVTLDWSAMLKRLDERDFDAHAGVWVLSWDVDPYPIWHSREADLPKSLNRIGFRNARADALIDAIREARDEPTRISRCHAFHALLHQEQPYTFIYQRERAFAYRRPLNPPEFQPIWPHRDVRFLSFSEPRP